MVIVSRRTTYVSQPLEDDDAAALTPGVAIGAVTEGVALAAGRDHARLAQVHEDVRQPEVVDAAADGYVTVT